MSEEYEWTPFGESLNGDDAEDVSIVHTFSRLTGTSTTKTKLSWQGGWTPRNIMEDPILREFSEKCDYYTLSKFLNIDIAIATIDGYLYIVVDWEKDDYAEHSNNSMSFRIEL